MADEKQRIFEEGVLDPPGLASYWEKRVEEKMPSDIRKIEEDDWPYDLDQWGPGLYKILFIGGITPVSKQVDRWTFDTYGKPLWAHIGGAVFNYNTMISIEKEK